MNAAVAVKAETKSIEQSREEIYALFGAKSQGDSVWNNLEITEKKAFCMIAGVTISDLSRPLCKVNQFDRRKLFLAIQSLGETVKKFDSVSLQDFK